MVTTKCESVEDAIRIMKRVVIFASDLDYKVVLLWAAHTFMRAVLPPTVCVYLAFSGPISSGKSTATRCAVFLASKGKMLDSTTPAALKRQCDQNITLGIDEVDAQMSHNEALATLLRSGNSWDATATLCERVNGKIEVLETKIGGPKAFNFREDVDDALMSRCLVVRMPCIKDADTIVNSLFYDTELLPVKNWLMATTEDHLKEGGFSDELVQHIMQDELFKGRVKEIEGDLGRNVQLGAILLMVSDIMGWNLDQDIKEAVESQQSEDPFAEEKEIIADFYRERTSGAEADYVLEVPVREVRSYLDEQLTSRNKKTIYQKRWGALRRECGWREGFNIKKNRAKKGVHTMVFTPNVLKALGIETGDTVPDKPHQTDLEGHDVLTEEDNEIRVVLMSVRMGGMTREKLLEKNSQLEPYLIALEKRGFIGTQSNGELFVAKRG